VPAVAPLGRVGRAVRLTRPVGVGSVGRRGCAVAREAGGVGDSWGWAGEAVGSARTGRRAADEYGVGGPLGRPQGDLGVHLARALVDGDVLTADLGTVLGL